MKQDFLHFDVCNGALSGQNIPVVTSDGNFRNLKKFMFTNVFGVVNFDLTFHIFCSVAHDADI